MEMQLADSIKENMLFSGLSLEEKNSLLTFAEKKYYKKNTFVFLEEEKAEGLYLVLKGLVKMTHMTSQGKEVVVHIAREGSLFGEVSAFDNSLFPASAFTITDVEVLFFSTENLKLSVFYNSQWAYNIISFLSLRLRMFTRKLEARGSKDHLQRLASYLIHRAKIENAQVLDLGLSQELLGNMLGTSRESISRAFKILTEEGCIRIKKKEIHILNMEILENMGNGFMRNK